MKIVIDTNIIFSALINPRGTILDMIIGQPTEDFQFYTSEYAYTELNNHHEKLEKASKLSRDEIETVKFGFFKYIHFITLAIIPVHCWEEAEKLVSDIDPDDIAFVALALYLQAFLWTGDKVLYNGLKMKGFNNVLSTADIKELR
jgi:putative PIN family toxin of toxin-antitoxin system